MPISSVDPEWESALNSLAWLLATCPEETIRSGHKAVEHARRACELSNWQKSLFIDTLAAAYAEVNQFEEAIVWQKKAVSIAPEDKKPDCQSRLELYQAGKPYRQSSS